LDSKSVERTDDFARQTIDLPGPLKRVIAICADSIMMPLALWAALSLRAGTPIFSFADWPAYVAVVAICIPIFVRLGLYRAVIRFLGHQAIFAVAFAVSLSGVLLGGLGYALKIPALSGSVVTIYSCLALLYVAGSRVVVRYFLLTRYIQPTVARVAIYGAGDAGARLSTRFMPRSSWRR
jgi:FlaA1/EpsC-like NDP-sugar epimerase